ncbi:MAG: nitroreductase family protein [Candidatus Thermoplasmatota archaeon]
MDFKKVIQKRESVRKFKDKNIEDSKIKTILECARWAPSALNKQSWEFIVVKSKDTIQKISKASHFINRWMKDAPVIIIACGDPKEGSIHNEINYYSINVAIAMEHLILAATNEGLGSCWIAAFDEKKIKKILDIPEEIKVIALTPLGYPSEKQGLQGRINKFFSKSKKRKSLNRIVHREKW